MKISISIPEPLLKAIDDLAEEVGISRSEVIQDIIKYVLNHEDILNEIYPLEEEEEIEEEEEEGEEIEEEEE